VRSDRGWPRRPEREAPRHLEFAKRFTEEHRETFDRLAE
jgi:hypothetical protein